MKFKKPANRLVIGDVGSGKTLVALLSILSYLESGYSDNLENSLNSVLKAAFMAPTEVLATQHYQKLSEIKKLLDLNWLNIGLLTAKEINFNDVKLTRKRLMSELNDHSWSFWIGTHALLYLDGFDPDIVFTDEQHRFGVNQRQKLATGDKNYPERSAHYVSMTATPIPRTLALTVFGDLNTSYLKKIQNRSEIITSIELFSSFGHKIKPILLTKINAGQKIYVICPAIESNDEDIDNVQEIWSVDKAESFFKKEFPGLGILTLHGKLKTKQDIMTKFKDDPDIQILISTTVIEVGIDVAEATAILILNPERFGLAQLHQIRGRVGRNSYPDNYCFLIVNDHNQAFIPRLKFITTTQDGFAIAQEDLRLRGQGDVIGTMQSGTDYDIYGLPQEDYPKIKKIVDKIDFNNLDLLPDLQSYLEKEIKTQWNE